jgi:hypothetical protein
MRLHNSVYILFYNNNLTSKCQYEHTLGEEQCGFSKGRSSSDCRLRVEDNHFEHLLLTSGEFYFI